MVWAAMSGVKLLDLFSGIGGFSLAAQWVWKDKLDIVGFCEIDQYCRKVLKKNFPDTTIYNDIKTLSGFSFNNVDIITGGFPCQDISQVGRGEGIEGERSGLWSEMHRVISEVRPRFAIIENVPMLATRGGTRIINDLAKIGYDAEWQTISAKQVGAWHQRERIWIVAYANGKRLQRLVSRSQTSKRSNESVGLCNRISEQSGWNAQPRVCRVANGVSNRMDRLKGLGNAIVPQIAYYIFSKIKQMEIL